MNISQVWTEKYRPKNIDELILSDTDKEYFTNLKEIPNNMLFLGEPGSGKTTIAKILANKFAPYSYLFIQASEQGNIDTVRNLISDFIAVASIDGNQKIVILNEIDGCSLAAQQALRSVMEDYLDTVKFILTANYSHKIIDALHSRCQTFKFSASEKQILNRVVFILKSEKITINKESLPDIRLLIKEYAPDIRKTINELHRSCNTGTFVYNKNKGQEISSRIKDDLKNVDVFTIRQTVLDTIDQFDNDYHILMKELFHLYTLDKNVNACILIADYMYKHAFVADPEINFSSLLFNLKNKI